MTSAALNQRYNPQPAVYSTMVRRSTARHIAARSDLGCTPDDSRIVAVVTPLFNDKYVLVARNGGLVRRAFSSAVLFFNACIRG